MEELKLYGDAFGITKDNLRIIQEAIIDMLSQEKKEYIAFSIDYDKENDFISMCVAYYSAEDKAISTTVMDGVLKRILEG